MTSAVTYVVLDVKVDDDGVTTLHYDGSMQSDRIAEIEVEARRRSDAGRTCVVCKISPVSYFAGRTLAQN